MKVLTSALHFHIWYYPGGKETVQLTQVIVRKFSDFCSVCWNFFLFSEVLKMWVMPKLIFSIFSFTTCLERGACAECECCCYASCCFSKEARRNTKIPVASSCLGGSCVRGSGGLLMVQAVLCPQEWLNQGDASSALAWSYEAQPVNK